MTLPFAYYDLIETFARPTCAVCHLLLRDADRHLDSLLYEYTLDPETHRSFRAARGLCNEHSWQLKKYRGSALGTAILFEAALDEAQRIVEQTVSETPTSSGLRQLFNSPSRQTALLIADRLEPVETCSACRMLATAENGYLQALADYLSDARMQAAFRESGGLCLPHFRRALRAMRKPEQSELLISIQRDIWNKLRAELEAFKRKNDYQFADEAMGSEADSWLRAIALLAGEKGVFGIDHHARE